MKIAFVYDRINTPFGGAEKVLLALHEAYPDAPFFTSVYDGKIAKWAKRLNIKTSFLQNFSLAKKHHRQFAPLMPLAFETLDFKDFEIIISVTSAEAIGIITSPNQLHICYLLTPPRYLFSHNDYYLNNEPALKNFLLKLPISALLKYLQRWYTTACRRPDYIIPISQLVKKRCQIYFKRDSLAPIYPPVENKVSAKKPNNQINNFEPYYLCVSRLLHYKRIDLAIKACHKLNKKLVIIGSGPEKNSLLQLTKVLKNNQISFIESADDQTVSQYYDNCQALIMPGEEDFGITGLEANSHGKPAIVFEKSGIAEVLHHQKHGIHFCEQSVESLAEALIRCEKTQFDEKLLRQNALNYGTNIFVANFKETVNKLWNDFLKEAYDK